MLKRVAGVSLALLVLLGAGSPSGAQSPGPVYRVPVTGVIELGVAPYVERAVTEAAEAGAAAVILDLDTPGGRIDAAERISDALADSRVPTYAFVNRRAFSAGALIALSTTRVYMRPGSVMGAATPVDGSGRKASEKVVSAMRKEMAALAEARGLDPEVAMAMVDEDIGIEGVVDPGKLLTLTTEEAVSLGYAVELDDFDALLGALDLRGAVVIVTRVNWAERVVRFLSHPVVAPFLLSLGFLGLLVELKTPTFGMAGTAGLIALTLYFGSHLIVGLAGLEDILVFVAGLGLVGVEVLVIPGFGLFGILGALGILAGLYMSLLGSFPTMPDFTTAGMVISTTVLILLVSAWALIRTLPRSSRLARSGILLLNRTDRRIGYESAHARDDLVGTAGKALTDLRPSGTGLFGEERIDVVSESEWIQEGTPIRIVSAEGYRHVVRPVSDATDN